MTGSGIGRALPKLRFLVAVLAALCCTLVWSCRKAPAGRAPGPLRVVVTVAPLKGLVQPLLPVGSEVSILMQPGRSEHGYEFTPSDIALLGRADMVVYIGLGLEGNLESVLRRQNVPGRDLVCVADLLAIKPDASSEDSHEGHDHDHHDHDHSEHHHTGVDPHLWLDPLLMADFARAVIPRIEHVLDAHAPQSAEVRTALHAAAASHVAAIERVDHHWRDGLAPFQGACVVTSHNAFSRPAARYGFKIAAVIREFESAEPTAADLAKVVDAIREQHVRVIFTEPQFNAGAAEKISVIAGVGLAQLDPLGNGDWFALMESNLASLVTNLAPVAPGPSATGSSR